MSRTGPARNEHTVAWFHCFAGIAGDMALASLIDAGADVDEVRSCLQQLAIGSWAIEPVPVLRCGLAATHLRIVADSDGVIRTWPAIRALIDDANLPPRVKDRSMAAFLALANAEARLHRRELDRVHFHELAGLDTILDIVGTMAALEVLGVDEVFSSAIATGTGMIRSEHGHLPNPAPAVLALLEDAPLEGREVNVELTTPTGAAIISTLATRFGPLPAMRIGATGYGAGAREIEGLPNCTQVVIGIADDETGTNRGQPLVLLETNLDDATGEQLSDAVTTALAAGALDAWIAPVVMKKGRPGHVLSVLSDVALAEQLRASIVNETGSFGIRSSLVDRWATSRRTEVVEIDGQRVRVKVSPGRAKVEHDDAVEAAIRIGVPVREVVARAEREWHRRRD